MVEPHRTSSAPRTVPGTDVVPELLYDGRAYNEGPVWFADLRWTGTSARRGS